MRGFYYTEYFSKMSSKENFPESENWKYAPNQKMMMAIKRFGKVEEVAGLVAYLSSDESGFITGASLTIDGGFNI